MLNEKKCDYTDITVGIVTFQPAIDILFSSFKSLIGQTKNIIVVDNNSSNLSSVKNILADFSQYFNIHFIENEDNYGIAKALNQIMDKSKEYGEWTLLLDQDTIVEKNYLKNAQKYLSNNERISIITPRIIDRDNPRMEYDSNENTQFVDKCITSGSINSVAIWEKVGKFDEWMFIDGVDHEYCKRVTEANFKILKLNSISIEHKIGDSKIHKFFGIKIEVLNHSPFRKYYIVRNIIYYGKKHNESLINVFLKICKQFFLVIFFEKSKLVKIKRMYRGVKDGIRKKQE